MILTRSGAVLCAAMLAVAVHAQVPRDRPAAPAGTAAISGRVILKADGPTTPVRRARVTLESASGGRVARVDTDTDGRFQFATLPAGSYRLVAEKSGFVPYAADLRRAFARPASFDLADGASLSVDVEMARGAAIEGRIVTESGDPAINVVVSAERYVYAAGQRRLGPVQQARTDDRGQYRIHTLPPGDYFVDAGPDPLDVAARATAPTTLAHTLYPGTARIDEARSIALTIGQNVGGMDLTLSRIAVVELRGVVRQSSGQPVKSMGVRLQRVGGPVGEVRGFSEPDGSTFGFGAVPPGDYWLMGVVRPSPTADFEYAATRLTVAGQPMINLVVTTERAAVIAGQVDVGGGSALPANLEVVASETDFSLPPLGGTAAQPTTARVDPSGTFAFSSLFGPRQFEVRNLPPRWAVQAVTVDGTDVTETAVDFRPGDHPRAVRVMLTSHAASVRGVARDGNGQPVTDARVVIFPNDPNQWRGRSRLIRAVETDRQGQFVLDGLVPGTYAIAVVPYLDDGSWMDIAVLRELQAGATRLTLAADASLSIDLKVRP